VSARKLRRNPDQDRPADNASGELILKTRQVTESAAHERQICNVADYYHTFFGGRVYPVLQQIRAYSQVVPGVGRLWHIGFGAIAFNRSRRKAFRAAARLIFNWAAIRREPYRLRCS